MAIAKWGWRHGVVARRQNRPGPLPAPMQEARARVFAPRSLQVFFLNSMNADNMVDMIKEGVMVWLPAQQLQIGRKFTKRTMPW